MLIASIMASILPIFIYFFILRKMNTYKPKQIKFLSINFLWGATGAIILSTIFSFIISQNIETYTTDISFVERVFIAPPIEELMKGIFLFFIIRNINWNNLINGFIYGGALGLGFGMTENFLYFITYTQDFSQWLFILLVRTFFTVLMHVISTATLGGFLGIAKFTNSHLKFIFPTVGFLIATAIHFCWNYGTNFDSTYYTSFILMLLFFTVFYFIFKMILKKETQIITEEFYLPKIRKYKNELKNILEKK